MTEYKNYVYNSVLAPYIQDFISEKGNLDLFIIHRHIT